MNLFDVYSLVHILHQFTQLELSLLARRFTGQGAQPVPPEHKEKTETAFAMAELFSKTIELEEFARAVRTAKQRWTLSSPDISSACEILNRLQIDIVQALEARQFHRIADDRLKFVPWVEGDTKHPGITGVIAAGVFTAFPSASDDIKEVGNCLAAECNTAAVFHLMRAAEVALRAVASDREVDFADKPLDQHEWGTILPNLEGRLKKLREDDVKNWPNPGVKDVQLRFYNEVTQELRGFNEAWRRHLSHAREDGIYDRDYANSVFTHVRSFMQKLAERISETAKTPKYWITA